MSEDIEVNVIVTTPDGEVLETITVYVDRAKTPAQAAARIVGQIEDKWVVEESE